MYKIWRRLTFGTIATGKAALSGPTVDRPTAAAASPPIALSTDSLPDDTSDVDDQSKIDPSLHGIRSGTGSVSSLEDIELTAPSSQANNSDDKEEPEDTNPKKNDRHKRSRSVNSEGLTALGHDSKKAKKAKTTNAGALKDLGANMASSTRSMVTALNPVGQAVTMLYRDHIADFTAEELTWAANLFAHNVGIAQAFCGIPLHPARVGLVRSHFAPPAEPQAEGDVERF
jgi:hypothetical protein